MALRVLCSPDRCLCEQRPSNEKPKASEAGKSVDAAVPPKKKPKKKPAVGDGGGAGGVGGATSTETAVTTKASATAAASAVSVVGKSSPIADTVGPVSSAATCAAGNVVNAANTGDNAVQPAVASVATREGGRGDGVGATVGVAAAGASTLGVQGQVAATSSSSLGSNAATAAMVAAAQQNKATGGTSGIPVAATQVGSFVSSERDAASAVAVGSSSGATAAAGGGGAGKGGGALKTAAANTVLMVQSLDPALKVALARFEEGESGRRGVSAFYGNDFLSCSSQIARSVSGKCNANRLLLAYRRQLFACTGQLLVLLFFR